MKNLHEIRTFSDWQLAIAYRHTYYGMQVRLVGDQCYYYDSYYSTEDRYGQGNGWLLFIEGKFSREISVKDWINKGRPAYNPVLMK